jgi:hypothetical protein
MTELDQTALRKEYEAMAARAGLTIPPERDGEMFRAFVFLRDLLSAVHRPWSYNEEPAYIAPRIPSGTATP